MVDLVHALASHEQTRAGPHLVVDAVEPDEWNQLLVEFDDISYDQTVGHSAITWNGRTSRFMAWQDGRAVGGAIVAILRPPLLRSGLAYVKFGPFWRRTDAPAQIAAYRTVVQALIAEYCERRGHYLSIVPRPSAAHLDKEIAVLEELGFQQRRHPLDPNRYLVDLRLSEEEQRASLAQKWRYNLRRGEAHRLTVSEASLEAGYPLFLELHRQMVDRKKFVDVDKLSIVRALQDLPMQIRPRLFFAARNGTPLAGAVVGVLGDTAYYVFGASAAEALSLNAGYTLQWHILRELRRSGAAWYDLGGEATDPGLRQFKSGLVGKAGLIVKLPGELDLWRGEVGRRVADGIYALRAARRRWRSLSSPH